MRVVGLQDIAERRKKMVGLASLSPPCRLCISLWPCRVDWRWVKNCGYGGARFARPTLQVVYEFMTMQGGLEMGEELCIWWGSLRSAHPTGCV